MSAHVAYYRMPWWMWVAGPFLVLSCEFVAWEATQPGMLKADGGSHRALMNWAVENVPGPVLAAFFALFGLAFFAGLVAMANAGLNKKPAFRLDPIGVTAFSIWGGQPRFMAWPEMQRLQMVQQAAVFTGGRKPNGRPASLAITLPKKQDRAALAEALQRYRPDLAR